MSNPELGIPQIIDFLRSARKMETTYRFTPKPDGSFENDAEHSWSVALICMLVASRVEEELGVKIDELKMLRMAVIHDLAEVVTGDTKTWDDAARLGKEDKERSAITDLFSKLPNDLGEDLLSLWEECEKRESIEAMIVKSVDRFDPVIHRTVFDLGWDNVEDQFATSEALDSRQLPRHVFSKTLTDIYTTIRDEAVNKGMFRSIDEELSGLLSDDLLNGSTPG